MSEEIKKLEAIMQQFPSRAAAEDAMNRAADFLQGALAAARLAEQQTKKQ